MHARFAEDSELAAFAVLDNELTNGLRIKLAGVGDTVRLVGGGGRADVRVEATRRGGDQIDRYRLLVVGISRTQRLDTRLDGIGQGRVRRPQIRSRRGGSVILQNYCYGFFRQISQH